LFDSLSACGSFGYQAEVIQVGCDSFQQSDHPRPVETNKLCLDICIGPKIHNHAFATLQSLQPVKACFNSVQRKQYCTSTYSASMISQTKSCRIRSESNHQNWRTKGTQFWELQKGQNSKAGTVLDKILFRIWYLCWNLTYVVKPLAPQ
jgi:hypothetical protein